MKRVISRKNEKGHFPQLNMTSMIDVIFLLLIFFVFTTNFNEIEMFLPMPLKLPGKSQTESKPEPVQLPDQEIQIRVFPQADGNLSWLVNDTKCTAEQDLTVVLKELARKDSSQSVIIYPADSASVENILDLYGLCRSEGFTQIRFAAKKK